MPAPPRAGRGLAPPGRPVRLLTGAVGARGSLQRRLVVSLVAALTLCVAGAALVLTQEFFEHLDERAEEALRLEASEIAGQLDPARPFFGQDPAALRFAGDGGAYRYTVFDARWRPVLGNELGDEFGGELGPDAAAGLAGSSGMIPIGAHRLGVVVTRDLPGGPVHVLATTRLYTAGRLNALLLRHELDEAMLWLLLAVVFVLMAAIVTARRAMLPLTQLMEQAGAILPGAPDRRLAADRLPTELAPLVAAVNDAFDRLELGYQAQRDFASNVAHEIRTPLAVLRSAIEGVENPDRRRDLLADLGALDRLFEQMIDLARADALDSVIRTPVCLRRLAVDFAAEAGPGVLRAGRALAVSGAARASARGHPGLLTVALSNLVRNALAHSPPGSEVEIEVSDAPPGWRVLDRGPGTPPALREALFERFRRGQRGGAAPGAGIGLAIVKAVAEGHGGSVGVEPRPGGGSIFWIRLPAAPQHEP